MSDFRETITFSSASNFLDYLQPRKSHWLPENETVIPWVFRGQYDADWQLEPSAFRKDQQWFDDFKIKERSNLEKVVDEIASSQPFYRAHKIQPDPSRLYEMILQVAAEKWAVEEFISLANHIGHPIPEDKRLGAVGYEDFNLEDVVQSLLVDSENGCRFAPAGVEYSLAQHHGIPTRALDWTYSPFVAAFFAAEEATKRVNTSNSNFAVWAIMHKEIKDTDLITITQKKSKISYLQAQAGLFICDYGANSYFLETGRWRTFEEVLSTSDKTFSYPILRKLTLPIQEVYELLRLLAAENITRAHIMPTFDNIIETLKLNRTLRSL